MDASSAAAPSQQFFRHLPREEQLTYTVAKKDTVLRALCRDPSARNKLLDEAIEAMVRTRFPHVLRPSGPEVHVFSACRAELGIAATSGPPEVRKVYVNPRLYEAGCRRFGLDPTYRGVIKHDSAQKQDRKIIVPQADTRPLPTTPRTAPPAPVAAPRPVATPSPVAPAAIAAGNAHEDLRAAVALVREAANKLGLAGELTVNLETGAVRGQKRVVVYEAVDL